MIDLPTPSDIAELKWISRKDFFESKWYDWGEVEKILRVNRTYKAMINSQVDEHHLIAVSKSWSNSRMNKKEMLRGDHIHHHDVFWVKLPHEQVEHVLDFNRKVFLPVIVSRLYEILDNASSKKKMYKSQAFIS